MKNNWKTYFRLFWKGWGCSIFVALIIATSFKSAIADWNIVPTGSMKPTILEGDRIFINKLAYDLKVPYTTWHLVEWNAPQRGDIVVFYSPADGKRLVKRVVGMPGDTIAMHNNSLVINGEKLDYEPIIAPLSATPPLRLERNRLGFYEQLGPARHAVMISPQQLAMRSFPEVIIPSDQYFMMGDNRDNSADSRYFGFVDRSEIVGKATSVVISLDINNHYLPRWKRFFTELL